AAVRTPRGVSIDGGAPGPRVRARGPVRIGDTLHRGDVFFEAVAGAPSMLRATAELPLDAYVAGVVAAEIELWSAEPEELRTMAIAARTFAVRTLSTRGSGARLTDGVLDQAYRGAYVPPAGSARAREVLRRLEDAVDATRGTVVTRGARLEDVRYHASCGGHTSDLDAVFRDEPDARAGSVGVPSPPCEERARAEFAARAPDPDRPLGWMATLERADLDRAARAAGLRPPLRGLAAAEKDRSGRWIRATLVGSEGAVATVSMNDLRRSLGYRLLPSAWIVALRPAEGEPLGGGPLLVQGRGRGHGVGLCQEGVRDLARRGWDHRRILAHYLPGARLARLDEIER
ncbi:MAG: SpoIID/LytB domain-containing protein, partial [Planctomycetota bacterium]